MNSCCFLFTLQGDERPVPVSMDGSQYLPERVEAGIGIGRGRTYPGISGRETNRRIVSPDVIAVS